MPKSKKILINIKVNEADYKILDLYGFDFDSNIEEYLNGIANELRQAIAEKVKGNNKEYD